MKKIILLLFVFIYVNSFGQAPSWVWAKRAGGTGYDFPYSITTDATGNIYITGLFYSRTIVFGTTTLINTDTSGTTSDIFIVKYDATGAVLWAKGIGGKRNDVGYSVVTNATGNIYVTGSFDSPTIIFGNDTLINADTLGLSPDIFLVKYDATGALIWVKRAGEAVQDDGFAVAADAAGDVYVTGDFGYQTLIFDTITLHSLGGFDMYIVKYDSAGAVIWAKNALGELNFGTSVATDATGDAYVTGNFKNPTLLVGATTLTNADNTHTTTDMYIAKYNATGAMLWAKSAGGTDDEYAHSVTTDAAGNVYVTGFFKSPTLVFDTVTLTNADNTGTTEDMYIVKYNSTGIVLWAKRIGGLNDDSGNSVTTDPVGNVYVTGSFASPTIVVGAITLTNYDNTGNTNDLYMIKYNSTGTVLWTISSGETGNDYGRSVVIDAAGNVFSTGNFDSPTLDFGSTTLTNAGVSDMYLSKIDSTQMTIGINEITKDENGITIFPNPFASQTTISFSEEQKNTKLKVINVLGEEVYQSTMNGKQYTLDMAGVVNGIYFVEVQTDTSASSPQGKIIRRKFIKQ